MFLISIRYPKNDQVWEILYFARVELTVFLEHPPVFTDQDRIWRTLYI
jgi:hypothetical protein